MGSLEATREYDVVVVGGGFSGVWNIQHLRKAGYSCHLFEAASGLGGVWHTNCYPGARVDTEVPAYQFTVDGTWESFDWKERFPGRDELKDYFVHIDKVWNISKDTSYDSRVTAATWNEVGKQWHLEVSQPESSSPIEVQCAFLILCTGFASRPYAPDYPGLETFTGRIYHTSQWPQQGVDLDGKRAGVIGTGASGVQVIQQIAPLVGHLTVYQRTPNTALPMGQKKIDAGRNHEVKNLYPLSARKIRESSAGFLYEVLPKATTDVDEREMREFYEQLFETGGLQFWLGNYRDVLYQEKANATAYTFWREKTVPRLKSKRLQDILAPTVPSHPFGSKRVSLEQNYFEVFNRDNVNLVDVNETPIVEASAKGLKTKDGKLHEMDVLILATGFDAVTGGVTQIDVKGINGQTISEKWSKGVNTALGMLTSGFPNMFFVYGPQAPTAFATGPATVEAQGDWIIECLKYMKRMGYRSINPTAKAEAEWRKHVDEIGSQGLFAEAKSWYFGDNIPGKPRQALNYMAGMPAYKNRCWTSASHGYPEFVLE